MTAPKTFSIANDREVRRLGYGAMRITGQPNNFGPYANWEDGKKLLRRAVEIGVNFVDTARAYGPAWNERLVADALYPYSPELLIATKGGVVIASVQNRFSISECNDGALVDFCASKGIAFLPCG